MQPLATDIWLIEFSFRCRWILFSGKQCRDFGPCRLFNSVYLWENAESLLSNYCENEIKQPKKKSRQAAWKERGDIISSNCKGGEKSLCSDRKNSKVRLEWKNRLSLCLTVYTLVSSTSSVVVYTLPILSNVIDNPSPFPRSNISTTFLASKRFI